VTAERIFRWLQ